MFPTVSFAPLLLAAASSLPHPGGDAELALGLAGRGPERAAVEATAAAGLPGAPPRGASPCRTHGFTMGWQPRSAPVSLGWIRPLWAMPCANSPGSLSPPLVGSWAEPSGWHRRPSLPAAQTGAPRGGPAPRPRLRARFGLRAQSLHKAYVLGAVSSFRTGPELDWLKPDHPAEVVGVTSVLMPSWAVWYCPSHFDWAIGLSTGSRFVLSKHVSTRFDPFLSLAKLELRLP